SSFDRGRYFGRYGFDRGQYRDARRAKTDLSEQIDRVLHDVAFDIEVGGNIDRRVGDEKRFRMAPQIHNEDMADPPSRAQASARRSDRAHELVGVQAAFHQQLAFGFMNQLDRLRRRGLAVLRVDQLKSADIELILACDPGDLLRGPNKRRNNNP